MKVTIEMYGDNVNVLDELRNLDFDRTVDVDNATVERWRRVQKEYRDMQFEILAVVVSE